MMLMVVVMGMMSVVMMVVNVSVLCILNRMSVSMLWLMLVVLRGWVYVLEYWLVVRVLR